MAETRKKDPKFTTPKGVFKYPRLNEPDTKFKDGGEYSVKVIFTPDELDSLLKELQPLQDEAVEAGKAAWDELPKASQKKSPFKVNDLVADDYDADDEETGNVVMSFKLLASGTNKKTSKEWSRKPVIFDAKRAIMAKPPSIWGGTVGRVCFTVSPYFTATAGAGLSLRISSVQILDLVSGGQRDGADEGFDEEDGYEAEPGGGDFADDDADTASDNGESEF
jgi:hypothetical protein